jgi:hypothetical protein
VALGWLLLVKLVYFLKNGSCLHFLTGNDWYQLTLEDLPPQPAPVIIRGADVIDRIFPGEADHGA